MNVELHVEPWTSYLFEIEQFNLTTEKQSYSFIFTMEQPTDPNGRLVFNAGASTEIYFVGKKTAFYIAEAEISHHKVGRRKNRMWKSRVESALENL